MKTIYSTDLKKLFYSIPSRYKSETKKLWKTLNWKITEYTKEKETHIDDDYHIEQSMGKS